jgi:hypothetical protein
MSIKPQFVKMARDDSDSMFVYIDTNKYTDTSRRFMIKNVPKFIYFFGKLQIADVVGANETQVVATLQNIKDKIKLKKEQYMANLVAAQQQPQQAAQQQQSQQPQQQLPQQSDTLFHKKAVLLKKLFDLTKTGTKLTKSYNLESDYDEMLWEYNLQTNPASIQVNSEYVMNSEEEIVEPLPITPAPHQLEMQKKQEQLQKIQELAKLTQMQQMQKLQQWQYLQQLREQKGLQEAQAAQTTQTTNTT